MMKAQLIFEFLIAGAIFFGIVVYGVTLMNSNVSMFRDNFYVDKLNSKAIRMSEVLASGDPQVGLAPNWPFFERERIDGFMSICNTPNGYNNLIDYFELNDTMFYGTEIPHFFSIFINTSSGNTFVCPSWLEVPKNVTNVYVERLGIYSTEISADRNGPILKMKISVW
jgi:hypothetical protein